MKRGDTVALLKRRELRRVKGVIPGVPEVTQSAKWLVTVQHPL